jgi:polyketide cyclase/dehydrase/lipid transport protein
MLATMRYRDQPTIEVTQRVRCDVGTAWRLVTDINLPTRCSSELQGVDWLDGATGVAVGARFCGRSQHEAFGDWSTVCEVVEVEDQRRWVYDVVGPDGASATWAFEVEPASEGVLIRQWGRMGPGPSGLTPAIVAQPDKEARIISRRLAEWQKNMQANLEWVRSQAES